MKSPLSEKLSLKFLPLNDLSDWSVIKLMTPTLWMKCWPNKALRLSRRHKSNRKKATTQDGRRLRRYRRRWKIERLFAWLQNFRRIAMRFAFHDENYLGFVHLSCIRILLRCYL
jgi:transposase